METMMMMTTTKTAERPAIEPLLNLEEVSRVLGVSHWTLRHYVKDGRMRALRIGRRLFVEPCEVRNMVERSRVR